MKLDFAIRSVVVTIMAAVVAWLPMAIFLTHGMDGYLVIGLALRLLLVALVGCFVIGLPLALLIFRLSSNLRLRNLFLIANGAGLGMVFVSFLFGHALGAFLYGLPSLLAANAFTILGWLLIVKHANERSHA